MKRQVCFLVLIILALLFLPGCKNGATKGEINEQTVTGGEDTIRIGYLGDKGGYGGSECLKGIRIAVDDINRSGGLLGKKVELIEGDHGGKSSETVRVTQELVAQKVVAVIGDNTTGITKLAATVCQDNNVVLISPTASGSGVVEMGDYIFRIALLDTVAVPAVVKYLADELKWKRVALVKNIGRSYTEGLAAIFKPALFRNGIEIVNEQKIRKNDTDFSVQVSSLKQSQFDGLVFPGNSQEAYLFMQEMRKQGLQHVAVGGDGMYTRELIECGGTAVEGTMVYAGFGVDPKSIEPKTLEFVEKYKALYNNQTPDVFAAQAYDAVNLLADAIRETGSADPAIIKEKLAGTKNWQGVSGTITFDQDREPVKSPVYLLEVKEGRYVVKAPLPVS
ncbi:MAG TPA: ABC transporter substrate-binding protein [Bacillota bacterium]|nr:ABC transporter substrate-binding protein [Peptococcaceae bacterium MAG4]NLW39071.1 ABC transporter substrate-binding protein [Peptococcaceae bacterium]HPZ43897.1 ABC transporter substrate-binding protein [Bacillota bacterium]HQD76945.1 ABC transporter substrate-binding protein [Bacillota bacterium]HUM59074.1 ABC transporter substrate-binding protein [Bacillota bacterium]